MAVVAISDSILTDIADAIRSKNGTEDTYKPSEMPDAIEAISGGGITPTGTKEISITENGTTTEDVTNYANAEITVNVSGAESFLYPLDFPRKSTTLSSVVYSYDEGTVKIQGVSSNNAMFVNLTDIIAGRTEASPHPINNYPTWFTLPAGSHCVLTIKNVVNASSLSWNCNFRKANDTTSLDFGIGNGTHLNGETITVDVTSAVNVGNLFVYVQSQYTSGTILQFDIEFTVDGVRYF